jgi:hypothetical protein
MLWTSWIIYVHELELGLCEMDQEATKYWSASNLMWQFMYSYTMAERGGLWRTDRAVTTGRLPLNRGTWNAFTRPYISRHLARIHSNHPNPPGPWPYGSTGKGLGCTRKHDEPPPQHKSKSIHEHNINDKASSQVWYDHDIGTIF